MKKIKRVDVVSVGKVLGSVYGTLGLIFGAIFSLVSLMGTSSFPKFLGVGAVIFLPLVYGGLGFVLGIIVAAIYNLAAKYTGGIKMELEEDATPN